MSEGKVILLRPALPEPRTEPLPLTGRRIVGISYNPFTDPSGKKSTRPILWLDDDSCLQLIPEATQVGYGVRLERSKK